MKSKPTMKSHPLTKIQLLIAIIWMMFSLVSVNAMEQYIWFILSILSFLGLSVVTIYIGWLIAIKKEFVIYPHESFAIWYTKKTRGQKAANELISIYTKPNGKNWVGFGNLFSGVGCLILAIIGIVIIIRDLL